MKTIKILTFAALAVTLLFPTPSTRAGDDSQRRDDANVEAARVIKAHAGTTFVLLPVPGSSTEFTHTVDGVVRVSLLGNCTVHFDVRVTAPKTATDPFTLKGKVKITSADTLTTIDADVVGTGTFDPANGSFLNFHYDVTFTGGTGTMANARGTADIDGFAMFTSATTGTATWLLQGKDATHGHDE
jgi:hypothetical protein